MKKKSRFSKRTMALLVAAVLLLAGGTVTGTRAALNIQSDYYRAHFYLNYLQVHLLENGKDVCGGKNTLDGEHKTVGILAADLGYKDDNNLGSVEPGKIYQEKIAARNDEDVDEFVRLTIRKYWAATDENGKVIKENGAVKKSPVLNPGQIHLMYKGKDACNSNAWAENPAERTDESRTYYYKSVLKAGKDSEPVFDQLMIDKSIVKLGKVNQEPEDPQPGDRIVYTYEYKYDGCVFYIEADVQAIQTHNINDAIKSQWGVDNVTGSYNDASGKGSLTVK